jgi:hypothetical protein
MEKLVGIGIVLLVLALNLLARRRSCGSRGGCAGCGSTCRESNPAENHTVEGESPETEEIASASSRSR